MNTQRYPYLDGEIVVSNRTSRGFVQLHVFPDKTGSGAFVFGLQIRVKGEFSSAEHQFEASKQIGIRLAKAKFLLRSFRHGSVNTLDFDNELGDPPESDLNKDQVVDLLGHALARLYSSKTIVQLEIAGIALELGVDPSTVWSAILHLRNSGMLEVPAGGSGVRLTAQGAVAFDAKTAGLQTAIESVTEGLANRLDTLKSGLGRELSTLLDTASNKEISNKGLRAHGNHVKAYFTEITGLICSAVGLSEGSAQDTTEDKILALAKMDGSRTRAGRILSLSRSFERTALSFNESMRSLATTRPVGTNLLMIYVVLVLSELLDSAHL